MGDARMNESEQQVIEEVIGRIPRGRFLMTSCFDGSRAGLLVDSVQWLLEEPLLIGVSARKGHEIDPLIRDSRSFAIGFMDEGEKFLSRRFSQAMNGVGSAVHVEGVDPFETLQYSSLVSGSPMVAQCSTWIDCEVMRRVDLEHAQELFVGVVLGVVCDGKRVVIDHEERGD